MMSASLALPLVTAAKSGITINSFHVQPIIGNTNNQRTLNVTVDIGNGGIVAQNFTIKLLWDWTAVAFLNVTNFAPGARQSFTLAHSVAFDPDYSHYVAVSAGDAWSAIPVYRPPSFGIGSSNLHWWNNDTNRVIGLVGVISLATALIALMIIRRSGNQSETEKLDPIRPS